MNPNVNIPQTLPELNTTRLNLVALDYSQAMALFDMRKNPEHHLYTDTLPDESIEETLKYIEKMNTGIAAGKWLIWSLVTSDTQKVVGTVSLWNFDQEKCSAELGYGLIQSEQQKGYMKEALEKVIEYGFQSLKLREITAYTEVNNKKSIQLLEKLAFKHSDTIEENGYLVDKTFVMEIYVLKNNR